MCGSHPARSKRATAWLVLISLGLATLPFSACRKKVVSGPTPSQLTPEQVTERLEKLFPALEAADRELPRDTFDSQAIVEKAGREPEALFRWVRDETFLVPYRGALRGATGVLMDRMGNSLDRALLLAELMRLAGKSVRLAHADLTEEQAKGIFDKARPVHHAEVPRSALAEQHAEEIMGRYANQYQLNISDLRDGHIKRQQESAGIRQKTIDRTDQQTRVIADSVGVPSVVDDLQSKYVLALRDHWWVQEQDGSAWVEFDPTLPDAEAGKSLTTAGDTWEVDKLDSKTWHEIDIRVVVEQWSENQLKEQQALSYTVRPADLIGKTIVFRQYPMNWSNADNLLDGNDATERIKTAVIAEKEWLPTLTVDDKDVTRFSFSDSGDLKDPGSNAVGSAYTGSAGALERAFGGGNSESSSQPKEGAGGKKYLTAEWIDYEIRSPGQPKRTIRREVFDLQNRTAETNVPEPQITNERRLERGFDILGGIDILPLNCRLSPDFVQHLNAKNLSANRDLLLAALNNKQDSTSKQREEEIDKLKALPGPLYSLALARAAWSQNQGEIYYDSANVVSFHSSLATGPAGDLKVCQHFDIVANDVAVIPTSKTNPFLIRLQQGVFDTNAESQLLSNCGRTFGTAELFANAGNANWVTIHNHQDPSLQSVELSQSGRRLIEKDLDDGYVVIVPGKPIVVEGEQHVNWWRVNPVSGSALGVSDRGWGDAGEDAVLRAKAIENTIRGARYILKILIGILCAARWVTKKNLHGGIAGAALMGCFLGAGAGAYGAVSSGLEGQVASIIGDIFSVILTSIGLLMS